LTDAAVEHAGRENRKREKAKKKSKGERVGKTLFD
jgi:hypothetical protein